MSCECYILRMWCQLIRVGSMYGFRMNEDEKLRTESSILSPTRFAACKTYCSKRTSELDVI